MNSLPEWYIEWVERVSNIISFLHPFEWTEAQIRYRQWLTKNKIKEEDYMSEACNAWTFIHKQMELWVENKPLEFDSPFFEPNRKEILDGLSFLWKLFHKELRSEVVVHDNKLRYQWTIDLLEIDEEKKEVSLYDFKTWGIAKKKFWLPSPFRKPYSKMEKTAEQLSFYAETYRQKWYTIKKIAVVWLHQSGCYVYDLPLLDSLEINKILDDFTLSKTPLPEDMSLYYNSKEMKIRINTNINWVAYTNAEIELDHTDFPDLTPEQRIDEAIKMQKLLASKY